MTKVLSLGLSLGVSLATLSLNAAPGKTQAPVDKIFIPVGFDNNDNVEVIIHGDFTNSCSRISHTSAVLDSKTNVITVSADYLQYGDAAGGTQYCAQVMLPYVEVVNLGILDEGDYTVQYKGDTSVTAALSVAKSKTESPDDFLYAPIENAWLDQDQATGKQSIVLQGTYPLWFVGCQVMKNIQVENQGEVLVVLPVTEVVDTEACHPGIYDPRFVIRKGLSSKFEGDGLLHVRTMHSHSVNRFISAP